NAPIALAYPALGDSGRYIASDEASGTRFPVTVGGGEVVIMPINIATLGTRRVKLRSVDSHSKASVRLEKRDGEDVIEVYVNGKLFTAYHYSNENRKPFLWPVLGEGKRSVTRDYPIGPKEKTDDHIHHVSLYTAYGDVNGVDCWGEGEGSGYQHTNEAEWGSGDAYGWIRADNVWQDKDRNPVVSEARAYRFYNGPESSRLIDMRITFRADYGDVRFGDTKEGGLVGVRMADGLREKGGKGLVTTAAGAAGAKAAWGKPAAWCDYSGRLARLGVRGLAVFDHPTNLRHPTSWHVRDYGLMAANCFGYSHFTDGKQNGDFTLKSGESITFFYRVYVHSGDVEESDVAGHYADFANPPRARWGE
ncbi:MAG: PmoA family protein, partial [Candidatus Hydrogenedentes bacterium]|nr:PmoA family protein [Candidatus Hydrogenedentota bacterium]